MKEQKTTYTVSENTAEFIECIKLIDATYTQIYKAVGLFCGKDSVDEVMEKEVFPITSQLNGVLSKYLYNQIFENMFCSGKGYVI